MDPQSRGRSPSQGHTPDLRHSNSASPHPQLDAFPSFVNEPQIGDTSGIYNTGAYTNDFQSQDQFSIDPSQTYLDSFRDQNQLSQSQLDLNNNNFFHPSQGLQPDTSGIYSQQGNHLSPGSVDFGAHSPANSSGTDSNPFPTRDYNQAQSLDPSLLNFDPTNFDPQQSQQQTLNPSDISLDPMAAMQQKSPIPPHLLQPGGMRQPSPGQSPHASPSFQNGAFLDQNRARNTSVSLDPMTAYNDANWAGGAAFRGHRRAPSDTYSEISSQSAHASPYLPTLDSFDQAEASPMLNAQSDPSLYGNALGLDQFSLSEPQQSHISPGHSPHMSPNLAPQQHQQQQPLPQFTSLNNYGLTQDLNAQFQHQQQNPMGNGAQYEMFPDAHKEPFPSLSSPEGQADQMSPPDINITFAPPSRQPSFEPPPPVQSGIEGALSPPERTRSRNRTRAKSDSYAGSRPRTPSLSQSLSRGRSPSLQPSLSASLSPNAIALPLSRSPSPSHSDYSTSDRRSSTSSNPSNRDYLLDLADPSRGPVPSNGSNSNLLSGVGSGGVAEGMVNAKGRVQKHPATFACTLCPKRFTRAYNLRSHLRTHTDERPFVCSVCGKAFARQHDRKRHEGLHSGEKRFVCKGVLKTSIDSSDGGGAKTWGCGRRFARADALGRHFRSEAGRVCIKPLLDEEREERQRLWDEEMRLRSQQQQQQHQAQQLSMGLQQNVPMAGMDLGGLNTNPGFMSQQQQDIILPTALLQLYPEFASMNWNAPVGAGEMEDVSGRSSFDASSGADDWVSESEMGSVQGQGQGQAQGQQFGLQPTGGWNGSDSLSDFEGR